MNKFFSLMIFSVFAFIFVQPAFADTTARGPLAQAIAERLDKDGDGDVDQDDQYAPTTVEVGQVGYIGTVETGGVNRHNVNQAQRNFNNTGAKAAGVSRANGGERRR